MLNNNVKNNHNKMPLKRTDLVDAIAKRLQGRFEQSSTSSFYITVAEINASEAVSLSVHRQYIELSRLSACRSSVGEEMSLKMISECAV